MQSESYNPIVRVIRVVSLVRVVEILCLFPVVLIARLVDTRVGRWIVYAVVYITSYVYTTSY